MNGALYDVDIGHRREHPLAHSFRYRSYMWLFDIDRPVRLGWLGRYDAADHLDVRAELARRGLHPATVVVLTNLRVLGYVFNPLSLYWCYGPDGHLVAEVAEVHNTYGGRHAYVLPASCPGSSHMVRKEMYVSPFHPVDGSYRIRMSPPGASLSCSVVLERPGGERFFAAITGSRTPATPAAVARRLLRYPLSPLRTRALIQWQGVRLWMRGLEVHRG